MKNAYRVLLTRARQGMVIVAPDEEVEDATSKPIPKGLEITVKVYQHFSSKVYHLQGFVVAM